MSARQKPVTLATPNPVTDAGQGTTLPHTFLPSVHDLGVALATARLASLASTDGGPNKPRNAARARWTEQTFTPRADALQDLITTLPAETLADVAVQLGIVVTSIAHVVEDGSNGSDGDNERLKRMGRMIDRVALSCLVVVAREARVDLEVLDLAELPDLHASRFGGMEGAA